MSSKDRLLPAGRKSEVLSPQVNHSNLQAAPTAETVQRKVLTGGDSISPSNILQMQRAYGNQAIMQILRNKQSLQMKGEGEKASKSHLVLAEIRNALKNTKAVKKEKRVRIHLTPR